MSKGSQTDEARSHLAFNLRYGRTMMSWTQEQLAEKADLDRTQVGAIERQVNGASLDSLGAMAGAFGVPSYVLLMPPAEAQPIMLAAAAIRMKALGSKKRKTKPSN